MRPRTLLCCAAALSLLGGLVLIPIACPRSEPLGPAALARSLAQTHGWHVVREGKGGGHTYFLTEAPRAWEDVAFLPRHPARAHLWQGVLVVESPSDVTGPVAAEEGENCRVTRDGVILFGDAAMVAAAARTLHGR